MPPLRGDRELERYKSLLEEAGRFRNIVQWKTTASNWIHENLGNHTQKSIVGLMHDHREEVHQKAETRPEYRDRYLYHYDFVIAINGLSVFIETVFEPGATDDDAKIRVVSVHESNTRIK